MTTTEKKPRVQKPPAEIVGSFENVLRHGECDDGRSLFRFGKGNTETFVLAGTMEQAWKVLRTEIGVVEKMTQGKMSKRYHQQCLEGLEKQNGETDTADTEG